MTSKERFLAAVQNRVSDRVPVAPDISNYIPCKKTGLPFWDIYFYNKIPLWKAYLQAMDYFGGDAWIASCTGAPFVQQSDKCEHKTTLERLPERDAVLRKSTVQTPDGELTEESLCFRDEPPTAIVKPIKDFPRDFPRFKWMLEAPDDINRPAVEEMRAECEKRKQAFGLCFSYSGFQEWQWYVHGGIEQLSYAYMDYPEILDEWFEIDMARSRRAMELILSIKPDYVLFGGSGTITLASPELAMKYAIPSLRELSKMTAAAGVPTLLHSCGKSRALIDMLAEHTNVNCINPLEYPPMGDVILAEAKQARGSQIALMGNLHTTETMLRGTPELVRRKSLEAMRDAGQGGGFILSSGDQCGRETPDENLFAMIETAKQYGQYDSAGNLPLVDEELRRLEGRETR